MPLHLLVKWEVVSPNSRWGQLESIFIISSIPLFCFCISNVGGGVMFFSHFMLFPTFLEKNLGIHFYNILYSFVLILYLKCGVVWGGGCNVFLTFYAISNISRKKSGNTNITVPLHYSYWLNGRWFL